MALNLKDQLRIQKGELKPAVIGDATLIEYVHVSAVNFAREFNSNHKIFDHETYPKAATYLQKMLGATAKAINSDSNYKIATMVVMASFIASFPTMTEEMYVNASQVDFEEFLDSYIKQTTELFANVRIEEKQEYDGLS